MRAFQFVVEAKGVFGRKRGDTYVNDNGLSATFNRAEMYPDTKTGNAYKDHETTLEAINRIQTRTGKEITWVNRETPNNNAFAIAFMDTDDGDIMLWGRWYRVVPNNVISSWANNELPQGWIWSSKTAEKSRSGMTPQDLIKSENKFTSADELLQTIENNGASPEIMEGLRMVADGSPVAVFQGMADKLTSVRDHLGEIMSPLALISGVIKDTNAINARTDILKTDYNKCAVWFPQNKNNNLVDSEFVSPDGHTLGVSTKGDKGAKASVKNIYDSMVDPKNASLKKKYKHAVSIIETIANEGQKMGPLVLGERMEVIDKYLKDEILQHIDNKQNDPSSMSENAKRLFIEFGSKSSSPGYNIGLVLLANCAKRVAQKLNEDNAFQDACRAFLNQASIIQVYTDAKIVGADVHITGFRTVYPPKFEGKVMIDAGKNYTSTAIKGKFSFDIGKGAV
jgi:hypothetical protein